MMINRQKSIHKKHFKPLCLIIIFLGILLVTPVLTSAFEWDNIQEVTLKKGLAGYNDIEIYNSWLIPNVIKGEILWSGTLDYNTNECGINCEAIQTITLHETGALVDEVIFKTLQKDGSWEEEPIQSYQIFIKVGEKVDYIDKYLDQTKIRTEERIKTIWEEYKLGTELEAGEYLVKLEGKKNPKKTVDWIYKTQGETLNSWATWGGSDLSTGLIGYWNMDDASGDAVDSLGISNLTATGVTYGATGIINDAFTYSSGDFLSGVSDALMDTLDTDMTVSFWMKTTSGDTQFIINRDDNGADRAWWFQTIDAGDAISFQVDYGTGISSDSLRSNFPTNTGEWFHIVGVKNSTDVTLYVNATRQGTETVGTNIANNNLPLFIGKRQGGSLLPFVGDIDEVAIWNVSLSKQQVIDLYNGGAGLPFSDVDFGVVLNSPDDLFVTILNEVEFNGTATITGGPTLVNMSLFHNASGTFERNQTKTLTGTINSTTFNSTFKEGNYLWNIESCIDTGICTLSPANRTFSVDTTVPIITINLPEKLTDIGFADMNETLNWTIIESNLDSIWFEYNETNTTLFGLVNETTFKLEPGLFNLTLYANDTAGNTNSSFREWAYKIFENSETFNASTFETESETYIINVIANSSLTAASLIFDGTGFAGTQSGNVWSRTINIPTGVGTKSFHWDFTYTGSTISSNSNDVLINHTNFSLCGGDGGDTRFLNITFKDETSLEFINASIPASTWIYYLGSGTVNKSFTFSNSTNNFEYDFCGTPNRTLTLDAFVQYKQGNFYPQRIFDANPTLSNVTTNQILYLLSISEGLFTTYATINSLTGEAVPDVAVRVQKDISSIPTTVTQGLTDATGLTTLWLNPDDLHTFSFIKSGFNVNTFNIRPASPDTYQISMIPVETGDAVGNGTQIVINLAYQIAPSQLTLTPSTNYTFFFNVTRDPAADSTSMTLRSNGTILFSDSQSGNGILTTLLNTTNFTSIDGTYKIFLDDEILTYTKSWTIINITSGDFSLNAWMNFGNDLSFNSIWWGLFRYIVILSVLIFVAGAFYYIDPFDSAISSLTVAIIVVWLFGSFGWLTINTPLGNSIDNSIIPALFSIIMISFMVWRYKTQ